MAQPLICSIDSVERATWIIGEIDTGTQYPLCDACIIGWMLAKLDTDLTPEGKAHVAGMWAPKPAPTDSEGGPAGDAPKRRPGRPGRRRGALAGLGEAVADAKAEEPPTAAQEAPQTPEGGEQPAAADAG